MHKVFEDNPIFNREMVLQGFGIGVVPVALAQTELASGKLVALLEEFDIVDGAIEIRLAYGTRHFCCRRR